jgi:hypothetical protein
MVHIEFLITSANPKEACNGGAPINNEQSLATDINVDMRVSCVSGKGSGGRAQRLKFIPR